MAWSIFTQGGGDLVAKGWADQLLKKIGAPLSPGNEQFIYDWEVSEGGGGKFNPLNQGPVPGKPNLTSTGSQYGGGAADFVSWNAGLEGAVAYLEMPAYKGILTNLRLNNPVLARTSLWNSPWAASHYGPPGQPGANFSNAPLPGGNAVLPSGGRSSGTGPVQTTSAFTNGLGGLFGGALGSGSWTETLQRLGLILLGGAMILIGIYMLVGKQAIKSSISLALPETKAAGAAAGATRKAANRSSDEKDVEDASDS